MDLEGKMTQNKGFEKFCQKQDFLEFFEKFLKKIAKSAKCYGSTVAKMCVFCQKQLKNRLKNVIFDP